MPPVVYDLQGAQSLDHRDRGIARYVVELAVALEAQDPGRVHAYLLNPDLALPGGIEPLVASGKLGFAGEVAVPDGAVLHLPSTIELAIPLDRLFPAAARATPLSLVVTLFDLVQEAMPEEYLEDPGVRRRYRSRLELVRQADAVVSISAHTGAEATRLLGVPPERVHSIPLVPSPSFRPPDSRHAAVIAARAAVPDLRPEYVLYTAGSDGRKNVERLIEAWAQLPEPVRTRWQLVIACHLPPLRRNHFEVMAERLGLGHSFLATGFVDEATLVHLNQGAALAVMPSLDEGFGFPVAEALACGTPVIGSERTSIPELLPANALFDPTDVAAMAAAITAALTDRRQRARLQEWAERPVRTWGDVAAATTAVYDAVGSRAPVVRGRRPRSAPFRLAFTTPLPPQRGGVADYSARLLGALAAIDGVAVDAYVDGPPHEREAILAPHAPPGVTARPLAALDRVEALAGRYDAVVHSLGNSEFHTGALAALHRRGGSVLAHDVRLTNLYRFAPWQHPDGAPGGFHASLQRMYGRAIPSALGAGGAVSAEEADRWGLLMVRDAVRASDRFLVTSSFAAELARLDARPEDRPKVEVVPFGIGGSAPTGVGAADGAAAGADPPIVASFGVVNALKQGPLVVDAFAAASTVARPDARLVFVGPAGPDDAALIRQRAELAGLGDRVELTGAVDERTYRGWLSRASVAVQLRTITNGESSAAIGDCLAAGIPTIVTAIGANRALPEDAAVALPPTATVEALDGELVRLLRDPSERRRLAEGARRYAEVHSFTAAAEALYRLVASAVPS